MKKLALIVLTLALLCVCSLALADTYAVVYNTESLNVRTGPSTDYKWLGSVAKGEWVQVVGESGNWYQVVTVEEGISGYMSKNFLKTYAGNAVSGSSKAVVSNPVSTHWLNLRVAPSYSAEVLEIFYNGTQCTILDRLDGWYYVSVYKNGQQLLGYFRSEYLKLNTVADGEAYTVNTANRGWLNLRSGPSYESGVLLQVPYGETVSVALKGNSFWQVDYKGTVGYVDSDFLKKGGSYNTGSNVTVPSYNTGNAVVKTGNTGKLNLRQQAYANAKILGQYANGTVVTVLQKGTVWSYVQVNTDGEKGYMMTKYLSMNGSSTAYKTVHNPNGGSYVNLRSEPDKKSGNVNVRVPVGQQVNVLSWGDEWSQVSYNNVNGYMMTWFLK